MLFILNVMVHGPALAVTEMSCFPGFSLTCSLVSSTIVTHSRRARSTGSGAKMVLCGHVQGACTVLGILIHCVAICSLLVVHSVQSSTAQLMESSEKTHAICARRCMSTSGNSDRETLEVNWSICKYEPK